MKAWICNNSLPNGKECGNKIMPQLFSYRTVGGYDVSLYIPHGVVTFTTYCKRCEQATSVTHIVDNSAKKAEISLTIATEIRYNTDN